MSNPYTPLEITQELIDSLPEAERGPWQTVYDAREQHTLYLGELCEARNFDKALALMSSDERAPALVEWATKYELTMEEIRDLLTNFWSVTEAWSGDPLLRKGMTELLRFVGPLRVLGEPAIPMPDGDLTVYRGNLGEKPGPGSWTLDRRIAERFADMAISPRGQFLGMWRADGIPTLWRANVDSADVLGYFDDRGEKETVIVDEGVLRNVEMIAQAGS